MFHFKAIFSLEMRYFREYFFYVKNKQAMLSFEKGFVSKSILTLKLLSYLETFSPSTETKIETSLLNHKYCISYPENKF